MIKNMKNELKNILVSVLLCLTLIFAYSWILEDGGSGERVDTMTRELEELSLKKKESDRIIDSLGIEADRLNSQEQRLKSDISRLESEIRDAIARANQSAKNLDRINKELAETRKKIEEFKKNPPNRTGDDLINSIKIKTKK
jgi:septal ring factor EnvC (AmiA/AmiB activator)